jgi:hypothetical protein
MSKAPFWINKVPIDEYPLPTPIPAPPDAIENVPETTFNAFTREPPAADVPIPAPFSVVTRKVPLTRVNESQTISDLAPIAGSLPKAETSRVVFGPSEEMLMDDLEHAIALPAVALMRFAPLNRIPTLLLLTDIGLFDVIFTSNNSSVTVELTIEIQFVDEEPVTVTRLGSGKSLELHWTPVGSILTGSAEMSHSTEGNDPLSESVEGALCLRNEVSVLSTG